MKMPLSLLKSYLNLDEPLERLAETLTLLGIEVDAILYRAPRFKNIIAADVRSVRPHPSADKLQIAQVFDGHQEWQVVCGAKNCRAGLKVAFAKAGRGILIDEHGQELRIEAAEIRKVPSSGMLCARDELGVPGDSEGILELPDDLPAGQDLTALLWDPVFELSLTPNLGHCMSALGIARELSAALQKPLKHAAAYKPAETEKRISVAIETPLCTRYLCRRIDGVRIGPSPLWLEQTLLSAGIRPINNVVDATNYILLKTGQPLHAFDADRIEGQRIHVKTLAHPVPFRGLDGQERTLPPGALVIADAEKPLALAGILGGENSAVTDATHTLLLEAACFDALSVRKTARHVALRTESAQRFEKGIDWHGLPHALEEACRLIADIAGGHVSATALDSYTAPPQPRTLVLRTSRANQLIGTRLSLGEMKELLQRLGFKIRTENDLLHVEVPSFRNDVAEEIDLVEEVARVYGYNNIEKKAPLFSSSELPHDPQFLFERLVRSRLVGQGLQEILTCDLISPKLASLAPEFLTKIEPLHVLHAKSEEYSVLRPSLLPGALEVVRSNLDQKNNTLAAFEIGRIHFMQKGAPKEIALLSLTLCGKRDLPHWEKKSEDADYYDLKGLLETLFESLGLSLAFIPSRHPTLHPGRQADIRTPTHSLGSLGEIHPHLLAKLDIKQRVLYAELNLEELRERAQTHVRMQPLPTFPATERDITLALPEHVLASELLNAARSWPSPLIESIELTSLYLRNATLHIVYRDPLKTISFEEAEAVHAKLVQHICQKINLANS